MIAIQPKPSLQAYLQHYIEAQANAVSAIPVDAVEAIIGDFRQALAEDRQVFVFGNGGSAASAAHFATDLGKGASDKTYRRFRCHSLNDCAAWMTAIGNDYAYEDVFVRQLENHARPGDLAMVMSVSGNSPNLVKAVEWCTENGIHTIALVGGKRGRLAELADRVVVIEAAHYGRVEDCHMHICHMIAFAFMEQDFLQRP